MALAFTNASPARFTSQSSGFVTYTPLSQENDATKPANPGIGFSASTRISFRPGISANVALVGVRQPSYCERTLLFCSATRVPFTKTTAALSHEKTSVASAARGVSMAARNVTLPTARGFTGCHIQPAR